MGAQQRVFRRRISAVQSTKKITKAMELIAASRIVKAQQRVAESTPTPRRSPRRSPSSRAARRPSTCSRRSGRTRAGWPSWSSPATAGWPAPTAATPCARPSSSPCGCATRAWSPCRTSSGARVSPTTGSATARWRRAGPGSPSSRSTTNAKEVADTLIDAFLAGSDEGGIDEIHIVFTQFITSVTQRPKAGATAAARSSRRRATTTKAPMPLYEFEPSAEGVLDALLPRYIESRVWNALLQSAASESAARRRAMKSASDNADELIKSLTRAANAARQAEITQEISEIVGGAEALAGGSE